MIPKIIHYCWFGRAPLPDKAKKCIESWRKHCPDYMILEWNEDNFDIRQNGYTEMCCKEKKYAFLADYVRLQIIENEGGFYFDVDVELVRSLDPLCSEHAFFAFETDRMIATGLGFGAEKHHPLVHFMLEQYAPLLNGKHGVIGCPQLNTQALLKCGLKPNGKRQIVQGAAVFPKAYFNPYEDATGRLYITDCTYAVHWYAKSWMNRRTVLRSKLTRPLSMQAPYCARGSKKRTAAYAFCISQTAASAVHETRVCLRQAEHSSALSMPMTPYRRHFLKRFCRRLSSITVILLSATSYA